MTMSERVHAPEFGEGLAWLNTDRPLRLHDELRGQVVVLDFWTYCCINCMHILPDLAYLEHKYDRAPVTFIGVHSAKFANEASRETIRSAVLRYEIKHPVVVDEEMRIWRSYTARSWPTLVVIDSTGGVLGTAAGEGNRDVIDQAIAEALAQGQADGTLADGPLTLRRERSVRAAGGMKFPGKVLAHAELNRLFVADSNHNRIVIAELPDGDGRCRVVRIVGTGDVGREDGPSDQAMFNHPQGLAAGHGKLYVADTENHLIRAIDLDSYDTTTVVGTGEMDNDRGGGLMGTQQGINSPWDLAIEGSTLYVAMAGVHQIWRIDLPVGFARAFAGSGRENLVDGPTETAALAQPSGICSLGGNLYFADSEVSAIRGIDMAAESVFTVTGEGLFSFGDVDGVHPKAKLQHPLGVAPWKNALVVADTYNHKIKLIDPSARSVRTLFGTGSVGSTAPDGGPAFFEPGGLSVAGDELYVADTNNHRLVRIQIETGEWQELCFDGLAAPTADAPTPRKEIKAEAIHIATSGDVELALDVALPAGMRINPEAPWSVRVTAEDETLAQHTGRSDSMPLRVIIPADSARCPAEWHITASFACCSESDGGLCVPVELHWVVPVSAGGDSARVALTATVETLPA